MATRIEIRHVAGSKANQIEQFQLDNLTELTIGRDPRSNIAYDPNRDDRVSRQHAVIRINQGDQLSFRIADLGSSNGTRVNGSRIERETELLPEDRVELGSGGPAFIFDVQPRPPHMVARTRIVGAEGAGVPAATRIEAELPARATTAGPMARPTAGPTNIGMPPTKVGVGRETVQRMLGEERQKTSQKWMYTLAGVLVLVAVIGGGLWYKTNSDRQQAIKLANQAQQAAEQARAEAAKKEADLQAQVQKTGEAAARAKGLTPEEIVGKYRNAVVSLDVKWRLYDRESLKPVFQKTMIARDGHVVGCYVKLADGRVVRWLTTEDDERSNQPIGAELKGTGFVVSDDGFILTNKHVAASWMIDFNQYATEMRNADEGLLFEERSDIPKKPNGTPLSEDEYTSVYGKPIEFDFSNVEPPSWEPDRGGLIFYSHYAIRISKDTERAFVGRNEILAARFPDSSLSINADLVRASTKADVALIKISTPQKLGHVEIAGADTIVSQGAPITVLGYPGTSAEVIAVLRTQEASDVGSRVEQIPEPTVTPGVVSLLGRSRQDTDTATIFGTLGDVYQLTAGATAGNSGGPVFDSNGKVIAIFTYGSKRTQNTTWAVPIQYGRSLLDVQQQ